MHPFIDIADLDKLNDFELHGVEARLRELILTHDLAESDLRRCLTSLSNAAFVRAVRAAQSFVKARSP